MRKQDGYVFEGMSIEEQNAVGGAYLAAEAEKNGRAKGKKPGPEPWEEPIPLGSVPDAPPLPVVDVFPDWLALFIKGLSEATQTPEDLTAMLALAEGGAALAGKFRVQIREGWSEPTNIYTVTALASGERKSAVFKETMAPTYEFEEERRTEMAPIIAAAQAEHAMLEARKNHLAGKASKIDDLVDRTEALQEAKKAAAELAEHVVPAEPELVCDDVTPEKIGQLLVKQGGKILQAGPEGTAFEIAKGRYSEQANFDVYLKGHAGDPWRSGRVSRDREAVNDPALSVALAVQPDVIRGLASDATLRTRGFLARFLYSIPASLVGRRKIAPGAVPEYVTEAFRQSMLGLWKTFAQLDDTGADVPNRLHFSAEADGAMWAFEAWIEPLLATGGELYSLAGWANKLAGAVARIAAILHVAEAVGHGRSWDTPISGETALAAIRLGRDYLLPHAKIAFGIMGADERLEKAKAVWENLCRVSEYGEYSESAPPTVSRRDIHQQNRRQFSSVKDLDPVLTLLVDWGYLRPVPGTGDTGRGHASPKYLVNPLALATFRKGGPRTHCTHRTHSPPNEREPGEDG
jgi:hypothetical protein